MPVFRSVWPRDKPRYIQKKTAPNAGNIQSTAPTVPLTAHEHQKAANVRSNGHSNSSSISWRPGRSLVNGSPRTSFAKPTVNARLQKLKNKDATNLTSHCNATGAGNVRCHDCVPSVRSSPMERAPARTIDKLFDAMTTTP